MRSAFSAAGLIALTGLSAACASQGAAGGSASPITYFPLPTRQLEVVHSEVQSFMVDTIFSDLVRPYSMLFLPDGRTLIAERRGHLLIVRNGQVEATLVGGNVPQELRDLALHPEYDENGWIYISYYVEPTDSVGARTEVMRARLAGNALVDKQLIYSAGPFREEANWFGSRIIFDREGYLYVTIGGRSMWGTGRRPRDVARLDAQDLMNPGGKTMRLFDDGRIPPDNPFVGMPGALPEIYSYGHRQHQGVVLHPETGEIWATEHGEFGGSELNVLKKGANYGWPLATFSLNYDTTFIAEPYKEGLEPPIHHWTPSIAPSGLDFVTSDRYPGWKDNLLVAALVRLMVNRSVVDGSVVTHDEKLVEGVGRVRSLEVAPDGYIYLLTEEPGMLVRLLPAGNRE